jgi:hypothetical protein
LTKGPKELSLPLRSVTKGEKELSLLLLHPTKHYPALWLPLNPRVSVQEEHWVVLRRVRMVRGRFGFY